MGREALFPYEARLPEITMNNGTLPGNWRRATVLPIHKEGGRSLVTNYRPISLTSVVCEQIEHVIASYIRQVWEGNDWLYKGQHGFRSGYLCEVQVITVGQDIADALDNGDMTGALIVDFQKLLTHFLMVVFF
jgi:hypothetical protein